MYETTIYEQYKNNILDIELFYKALNKCKKKNKLFFDKQWNVLTDLSIYNDYNIIAYRYNYPIYNNLPSINDIKQGIGKLNNCYLLTALALLSNHNKIKDLILFDEEYGIYAIKYFYKGKWNIDIIDNQIPSYKNKFGYKTLFSYCNKVTWVLLFEKFWAKKNGSYINTSIGCVSDILNYFTGSYSYFLEIQKYKINYLWDMINFYINDSFIYTYGIHNPERNNIIDLTHSNNGYIKGTKSGLINNHSYAILTIKEINNIKFVKLHNPWGFFFWDSPIVKEHNLNNNNPLGTFWMTLEEYFLNFKIICFNQIPKNNMYQLNIDGSIDHNNSREYMFSIDNTPSNKIYINYSTYCKSKINLDIFDGNTNKLLHTTSNIKLIESIQLFSNSNKYILKIHNLNKKNTQYWITIYCHYNITISL